MTLRQRKSAPTKRGRKQVIFIVLLILGSIAASGIPAAAQQAVSQPQESTRKLKRALSDRAFTKSRLGIEVEKADDSGRYSKVYARNANKKLAPASLTKLFTSATALAILKPDYRFKTAIYGDGRLVEGVYEGNLYIKGYGDPTFVEERIWILVKQLQKKGITRVTGKLCTDATFFDRDKYGNGWSPLTSNWYHAPVGALSVNFNTYKKGDRYFAISSDPEKFAGRRVLQIMEDSGLDVDEGLQHGGAVPPEAQPILTVYSKSLGHITADLNKISNNFVAEQILKTMGAEVYGEPGTTAKGLDAVEKFLVEEIGFEPGSFRIEDGSGLSSLNRFTPHQVVQLLKTMPVRFDTGVEFVASLKVPGGDTHGQDTFSDPILARKLRIKTGHLKGVNNLAGYATTPGGERLVFCLMINNYRTGRWATDRAMERFARALVE
ncbi:D-alanyl-D-alanine carboxypeptidase/D-alanyl-D-alanine-endopeptidase [Acidobacteriota bacterium]